MPSLAFDIASLWKDSRWSRGTRWLIAKKSRTQGADRLEHVRQAMLGCLGESGRVVRPRLTILINNATDARSLWYLRGELMLTLAELRGEEQALRELSWINTLLEGLLPAQMSSRPMPLR